MNVFIDTNIFLNFYHYGKDDLDSLHTIFATHTNGSAKVYLTQQVCSEFIRNRETKIADALKQFKDNKLGARLPLFMKAYEEYEKIIELSRELGGLCRSIQDKANQDILNSNLQADALIQEIFDKHKITLSESIENKYYPLAKRRIDLGNPPGKNNSLGDAINWEILLDEVPNGEDLHLVSADGDFYSKLNEVKPHPVLAEEWSQRKSSCLYVYRELSKFLKEHFDGVAFSFDQSKDKLINSLFSVGNFAGTHEIIAELESHAYFSLKEVEKILSAAVDNNQFGWIVTDYDVSDFLNRIALPRRSEITNPKFLEVLQKVQKEQQERL